MFRKISTTIAAVNPTHIKPFQDIPGPKSYPIIGSLWNYLPGIGKYDGTKLHVAGLQKYEEFGDLVREEVLPGRNYLFIYNPTDIETMFRVEGKYPSRVSHTAIEKARLDTPEDHLSTGLLPSSAEDWYKFRIQFQKAMALENIQQYASKTDEIMLDFVENLDGTVDSQTDMLPYLLRLSLEVVGQNFFGMRVGNPKFDQSTIADEIIERAEQVNLTTVKTDQGLQIWKIIDTPLFKEIKQNLFFLEKTAKRFLSSYESKPEKPSCILGAWLNQENIDTRDVITMSADMLLGGIDTTSYSTGFMLYHLATNPECQEKLYKELKAIIPNPNSPISFDVFSKTPYLKWCIKESLRLNPISVGVGRTLQNDVVIGGYHVPAETYCVSMNQITCRLPKYFNQPNEFIPERWSPENRKRSKFHPYSIVPFGHGPRACIGRRLSEQQMHYFLARIFRTYQLEWTGVKELECLSVAINKPGSPIQLQLTRRGD